MSLSDLKVFQKSFALAMEIFEHTKTFPKQETYSLTDQIRRAVDLCRQIWLKPIAGSAPLHTSFPSWTIATVKTAKLWSGLLSARSVATYRNTITMSYKVKLKKSAEELAV